MEFSSVRWRHTEWPTQLSSSKIAYPEIELGEKQDNVTVKSKTHLFLDLLFNPEHQQNFLVNDE